jgi:hypothetical protein
MLLVDLIKIITINTLFILTAWSISRGKFDGSYIAFGKYLFEDILYSTCICFDAFVQLMEECH